ncbi:MAG: hypothetical protein ACRAVC_04285 [Trichormus sp.]
MTIFKMESGGRGQGAGETRETKETRKILLQCPMPNAPCPIPHAQ